MTIGIVGGVGPLAGIDIVRKIIEETIAQHDQEHIPVILSSQPHRIVDRTAFLLGIEPQNPAYALLALIQELAQAGASVVAIPCNTAHAPEIMDRVQAGLVQAQTPVKLLHLVAETASFIAQVYGAIPVGILSTTGTKNTGLYKQALEALGLEPIEPDEEEQARVHQTIYDQQYGIKAQSSPVTNRARQELIAAITTLKQQGAKAIILGCTELPLALHEAEILGLPLIDPNRILARALIAHTYPEKLKSL